MRLCRRWGTVRSGSPQGGAARLGRVAAWGLSLGRPPVVKIVCTTVMDRYVLSVKCLHGYKDTDGHTLFTGSVEIRENSGADMLAAVADMLTYLAHEAGRGGLELTDDCGGQG